MAEHPHINFVDVYAAVIPGFPFRPSMHCYYGERVLTMKDGIPKYADYPVEIGGSGELMRE